MSSIKVNNGTKSRLLRLLKKVIGPYQDGVVARKALTENKEFFISVFNQGRYQIKVVDGYAYVKKFEKTFCRLPFVPWDDIDEQYESCCKKQPNDSATLPLVADDLLIKYISRFDERIWER